MDSEFALYDADDARLLRLASASNAEAFGVLSERHAWAARKLARQLVLPEDVEEVVAEAFGRVRAAIARGGGPSNAVRPYMLTALRRVCDERQRGQLTRLSPDEQEADPGAPLVDPAVAGVEQTLAARAYLSLPERWRAVLWHTEIEQEHPLVVTPVLGLARDGIVSLDREAIDGLRQAFVQLYVMALAQPECESVAERLDAYVRDALPAPEATQIWEHLRGCDECRAAHDELADIRATLRGTVAPLILGAAADAYLHGTEAPGASDVPSVVAGRTDTLTFRPADGGDAAKVRSAAPKPRVSRHARRRVPRSTVIAAGVAAAAVISGTIAFAIADRPNGSMGPGSAMASPPAFPAGRQPSQLAPSSPPSPIPISAPLSPQASPTSSTPTTTTLSASLDISPAQFTSTRSGSGQSTDEVSFDVANTGSVASGPLTAAIDLPPGSSPSGDGPGPSPGFTGGVPEGTGTPANGGGGFGWSCEPTQGGITCTHAPIPAGQHADGRFTVTISGFMTCGQPVRLTASSGPASAKAERDLRC